MSFPLGDHSSFSFDVTLSAPYRQFDSTFDPNVETRGLDNSMRIKSTPSATCNMLTWFALGVLFRLVVGLTGCGEVLRPALTVARSSLLFTFGGGTATKR